MSDLKILNFPTDDTKYLSVNISDVNFILDFLPSIKELSNAIASLKFDNSETNKKNYSDKLKAFGNLVINKYSDLLYFNRHCDDLVSVLRKLVLAKEKLTREEKTKANTKEYVSLVCRRHYTAEG